MARNNVKYSILEQNGTEFYGPTEHIPLAQDITLESGNFTADNVEEGMDELYDLVLSDLDGGAAATVYLVAQSIDGGGAS